MAKFQSWIAMQKRTMENTAKKHTERKTTSLNLKLDRRLAAYIAAGSAAGVGLLALAQPAEAEIVYTATYTRIHDGGPNTLLDLNNDGIADFEFNHYSSSVRWLYIYGATNRNSIFQAQQGWAADLFEGILIGPKRQFGGSQLMAVSYNGITLGDWNHVQNRYLGLRFQIDGKTHYGWARITVRGNGGYDAIITGYAYETVPDRPIVSGQTTGTYSGDDDLDASASSSATDLGTLALGAALKK
jgi:hypothetical protein